MRDRLITLACALGALALFYTIFLPKPRSSEEEKYSQPTGVERGDNGYAAAMRWLTASGVRVEELRNRYETLGRGLPRTGNLLITTLPHRRGVRDAEIVDLRQWVDSGNAVLVLAALADTPDWTISLASSYLPEAVRQLTGVGFEVPVEDSQVAGAQSPDAGESGAEAGKASSLADNFRRLNEPTKHRMAPNRAHPLFAGVRTVTAESEFPASAWRAVPPYGGSVLSLAHDADTGHDGFWVRNYGKGRFLISGYASLFANERLGDEDNAQLLANIVAQSLGPQGRVLFDDQHQGLSDLYDAEAFFSDGRLKATLWLLLALWLTWVLGGIRLRGVAREAPAPRETAFVEATGGFLARVLRPAQAGARLLELFFNDLRRRLSLVEDGRPVWDWLERQPGIRRSDLDALRAHAARLANGRRVDLVRLQNLLVSLQGKV